MYNFFALCLISRSFLLIKAKAKSKKKLNSIAIKNEKERQLYAVWNSDNSTIVRRAKNIWYFEVFVVLTRYYFLQCINLYFHLFIIIPWDQSNYHFQFWEFSSRFQNSCFRFYFRFHYDEFFLGQSNNLLTYCVYNKYNITAIL